MQQVVRRAAFGALVIAVAGVAACGGRKDADNTAPPAADAAAPAGATASAAPVPEMPVEAQRALDAGNAAYRAKDYTLALSEFEKAAKLSPPHAAPWFGIYMVAQVRKDTKAADAALEEIRQRN